MKAKKTLQLFGFLAEFFTNDNLTPTVWHYVVTIKGQKKILAWGQEPSLERAEAAAQDAIQRLRGQSAAG